MAKKHYDVVCGIIQNERNEILLALRTPDRDQGGLWEFPGGKVEVDESLEDALCRELKEELGVTVYEADLWLQTSHEYENYHVTLHVWRVLDYDADPSGLEGQIIRWVDVDSLLSLDFPAANHPIVLSLVRREQMVH